ncbi:MAG: tetratricopeptide repeat protein, partial [Deltaproteobacteria bacterium]|nr:tetratricopeptide repeat protein [Deltaproteobacteria bacterium]
RVQVKGKTHTVGIYEVLDYHDEATYPSLMEAVSLFRDGLTLYRRRDWGSAITRFDEALRLNPNDQLCQMYVERCQTFQTAPPGEDWDGAWVMHAK